MDRPILVGAVAYDARVVPIWEAMRAYFHEAGQPIDYTLYSNYDRQVHALLERHIDIAWNTNLAWVKAQRQTGGTCRALAMRDVDVQYTTTFVARVDTGIASLSDLRGKRLALGSADSAQAAILPLEMLHEAGIDAEQDCALVRFDLDVGKQGDTGTSELEVLRALQEGQADAGALGTPTWFRELAKGHFDQAKIHAIWTSPGYCHCVFTALADFPPEAARQWTDALVAMDYDDKRWRKLMDLEGVKRWVAADPEILKGYGVLFEAVERQGLAQKWGR
jgi:ABC-type phosphate/phosphonate transport system substrate-binding protein